MKDALGFYPLLSLDEKSLGAGLAFISVVIAGCISRVFLMKLENGVKSLNKLECSGITEELELASGTNTNVKQ